MKKYWIDYLRVISMLAVIIIHVTGCHYVKFEEIGIFEWWFVNLLKAASSFAVPLFVMISGAVLLGKDATLFGFYKKRTIRLIPPIIFWTIFYIGFKFYQNWNLDSLIWFLKTGLFADGRAAVHLWYLSMFACLMLFAPFVNMFINGVKPNSMELGIFIVLIFLFYSFNCMSVIAKNLIDINIHWFKTFIWYLAYFLGGFYIDRYSKHINIGNTVLLAVIAISILGGALLNYYFVISYGISKDFLILDNMSPIVILITTLIFLLARKNMSILHNNKIISLISEVSFGVYLIHPFYITLISNVIPVNDLSAFINVPFMLFATALLSFLSIWLLRKIRFMKVVC